MPKLKEELRHFPYHIDEDDSIDWIKEKAVYYIDYTYDKLTLRRDVITTEEGYNVRCTISTICELEWRINNNDGKDTAYLYLKNNGYVIESKERLREILAKMKERLSQLDKKRNEYLAEIEKCKDKKKLLEMDIDWS